MGNVRHVRAQDWDSLAPSGKRTIRQIFEHAAVAKHAYAEHLFGAAKRSFMDVFKDSPLRAAPEDTEALIAWAREGHAIFFEGMRGLSDDGPSARDARRTGAWRRRSAG